MCASAGQAVTQDRFKRYQGWLAYFSAALFYCRGIFSGHLLFSLGGDEVYSIYSAMSFVHEWVGHGVFPFWNPLNGCGAPLGPASISPANLYYLAAILLKAGTAYNLVTFISIWLNGVFCFEFLLKKNRSYFAAWIGGLLWMISTSSAIDSGFFGLSLSFLAAEIYCIKKTRLSYVFLAAALAFYAVNAHPQFFLYGSIFIWAYMIARQTADIQNPLKTLFLCAVPFFFAFVFSSFQWFRIAEWTVLSNRSSWTLLQALLPTHYPLIVFPKLYHLAGRQDLDFILPRIFQYFFSHIPFLKSLDRVFDPPYMGLLAALGIFTGFYEAKKKAEGFHVFFLFSAGFSIVYLLVHPALYQLALCHVPILSGMTNVGRLFDVYQFSMAVLGACAVDFLIRREEGSSVFLGRLGRRFAGGFVIFIGLLASARFFISANREWLSKKIAVNLHVLSTPTIFITDVSEFQRRRVDEFFYFFEQCFSAANLHLLVPAGLLFCLGLMLYFYRSGKISKVFFQVLILLFVFVDLGVGLGCERPSSPSRQFEKNSDIMDFLKNDHQVYRVMNLEDKTRSFSNFFLVPQANLIYGVATPDAYDPLYIRRYVDFHGWLTRRDFEPGFVLHTMDGLEEALANFINVKYFITSAANDKLEASPAYPKIFQNEDYRIYRNKNFLPRAFLVHEVYSAQNPEAAIKYIRSFPERLKKEVVLPQGAEALPAQSQSTFPEGVQIEKYEPGIIKIKVDAGKAGYLVISDTYYPGWKAWVDGRKTPIILADYAFRAIFVPGGSHEVLLRYRSDSFYLGLAVSLLCVFAFLLFLRQARGCFK